MIYVKEEKLGFLQNSEFHVIKSSAVIQLHEKLKYL